MAQNLTRALGVMFDLLNLHIIQRSSSTATVVIQNITTSVVSESRIQVGNMVISIMFYKD